MIALLVAALLLVGASLAAQGGEKAGAPAAGRGGAAAPAGAGGSGKPGASSRDGAAGGQGRGESGAGGEEGLKVHIAATRAAGVAPLAVFFDATASTSARYPRAFHHLHFRWDFGDARARRPTATGPIAAHVFERPGRYEVTLTVTEPGGRAAQGAVVVEAADPAVVFAGEHTVCAANGDAFDGAPPGAQRVVTRDFDALLRDRLKPGTRLLLRRGDTFLSRAAFRAEIEGACVLGAFGSVDAAEERGSGAGNPRVERHGEEPVLAVSGEGLTIMDIAFRAEQPVGSVLDASDHTSRCLLLRVATEGFDTPWVVSPDIVQHYGSDMHSELFLVDCSARGFAGCAAYLGVERSAVLGNHFGRSLETHVLRLAFARDLVVCGNRLDEPGADRHTIKLHAQQSVARYGRYAERIVISDNELHCDAPWAVTVGPQNSESDEAVRDVLIERNRLLLSGNASVGFYLNSADTTLRNNLMVASDLVGRELSFVTVTQRGVEPVPAGVEVYHNTAVCGAPGKLAEVALVSVDKHAGGAVEVANNLLSAPGVRAASIARGPGPVRARGNVCTGEADVAEAAVRDPSLCPAAPAGGVGVEVPVLDDHSGELRPPGKPAAGAGSVRAAK